MVMTTVVVMMNPNRPWRDDDFAFFVVALAVA
jgi:hypothetical protein